MTTKAIANILDLEKNLQLDVVIQENLLNLMDNPKSGMKKQETNIEDGDVTLSGIIVGKQRKKRTFFINKPRRPSFIICPSAYHIQYRARTNNITRPRKWI